MNSSNSTPTVEPEFVDEFGDRIAINLSLTDQNLDLIDLLVEYSVDGRSTFHLASIVPEDSIKNIQPTSQYLIYWDSNIDIVDQDIESVILSFTPTDGREGVADSVQSNFFSRL